MRDFAFQTATCRHCGGEIERVKPRCKCDRLPANWSEPLEHHPACPLAERRTDDDDPWWHTATGHADCDVRIPQAEPVEE